MVPGINQTSTSGEPRLYPSAVECVHHTDMTPQPYMGWGAVHNEGFIFAMQLPSYRRIVVAGTTLAAAIAMFVIPASASAETYSDGTTVGGNYYSNGQTVGGNYYSDGTPVGGSALSQMSYGSISAETGRPRTEYVSGYTNSYGSYTDPYYRS